jgi:hypothetical protein
MGSFSPLLIARRAGQPEPATGQAVTSLYEQ